VAPRPGGTDVVPNHPGYASGRFRLLVATTDVPPIRLHDLRHGAASLAHEADADLKALQDLLGHPSIVITADTYTSVLPAAQRRCADATAKLVPAAARRTRDKIRKKGRRNRPDTRPATGTPQPTSPESGRKPQVKPQPKTKPSRTVTTPEWHPRDTHRPHRTDHDGRRPSKTAGQRPADLARPEGLEPQPSDIDGL
jgi:hypothetical protein